MDVVSPAEIEGALLGYLDGLLEALGCKDGMEEIEGKPLGMSLRMLDGSCDDIPEGLSLELATTMVVMKMMALQMRHLTDKRLMGMRWLDRSLGPETKKAPKMAHWMVHNLEPRMMREDHCELKTAIWLERLKEK
jgi:hypothetical protein